MDRTGEELLRAHNAGEPAAFEGLFRRHKGRLFNFALRYQGNRPEAEDVAAGPDGSRGRAAVSNGGFLKPFRLYLSGGQSGGRTPSTGR